MNGQNKAATAAVLRTVVAGYIFFLGWKIATEESDSMSSLLARLIGGVFMLAAVCFGVYIFKRWRIDQAAQETEEKEKKDADSSDPEDL
ncbi:MAG: hypothetical protein J5722_03405 [Oscillospiraceae bacterium]|nr:hypothetical protein [Oscillospiraceae bacterium]